MLIRPILSIQNPLGQIVFRVLLPLFCFLAPLSSLQAQQLLSDSDTAIYRNAFALLEQDKGVEAVNAAALASDHTLADVVYGLALAQEGSPYPFSAFEQFLAAHPYFPKSERKAIAYQAEMKMGSDVPAANVLAFFGAFTPQTVNGLKNYVNALYATNQQAKAAQIVRDVWRNETLDEENQQACLPAFSAFLTSADTAARIDKLLWSNKITLASSLIATLPEAQQRLFEARIALMKMDKEAPRLLERVPGTLQDDPGLLYERMRWRRKKDDAEGAIAMMNAASANLGHADEWWDERAALARALMDDGQYKRAYNLVMAHGMREGKAFVEAEFMAGWLALRFLNSPKTALAHFSNLYLKAETPITISRAAYWKGRALEALGDPSARNWFETASRYGVCYYGQLAANHIYPRSLVATSAPAIPSAAREDFSAQPEATRVAQLMQAGGKKAAEDFALAWAESFTTEYPFRLLADMALRMGDNDLAVKTAKSAAKKKFMLVVEGYPILDEERGVENPDLAHAITRQESQFDPVVVSPSNAQGLMQLLPSTAHDIAEKAGVDREGLNLFDPATNVRLGSYYINNLVARFDGSLPLAIAGYNAGPGRVRQWMGKMGDPRGGQLDMVDWVERIPANETRNYVQRVMEALQIYRAKLAGGSAELRLEKDLKE